MARACVTAGGAVAGAAIAAVLVGATLNPTARSATPTIPAPAFGAPAPADSGRQTVVFSGGCFWGVQAVFEHVQGVLNATAGYGGGAANTATYEQVSTGKTGHAESVRVAYDPSRISFAQLLQVFFSVVHDPTELNRQGPDHGPQYRSAIWYTTPEQAGAARAYIAQLTAAHTFSRPIVTQVNAFQGFYPAETYHQDYLIHHPHQPYIVINDLPKLADLKSDFPSLWREQPVTWRGETAAAARTR
jgi:peptide-methionine (S)-S-oxide reductase